MHILLAPDSFKGSLNAETICGIAKKVVDVYDDKSLKLTAIPLADGGEGTLECILAYKGQRHSCSVLDPLGRTITADWCEIEEDMNRIGVIEMAQASGLMCLHQREYNPMKASSYGTGQLVMDAIRCGCQEIYITLGGSATCDGGLGMLAAMGAKLYDEEGNELEGNGNGLVDLGRIDLRMMYKLIEGIIFHVAVDVDNPLLGPKGAIYTYGPQKGATEVMMDRLEEGMNRYRSLILEHIGIDLNNYIGGGAAGGLGATIMGVFGALPEKGGDFVMKYAGIHHILEHEHVDWIITGEGRCDAQTMEGKLPYRVLMEGNKHHIPVVIIAGTLGKGYEDLLEVGASAVFSIINKPMSLEEAMANASVNLEGFFQNIFRLLTIKSR